MTTEDFYSLPTGETFSRTYDLRQFLQDIPSGPSGAQSKAIQISLPTSFQGHIEDGSYTLPLAAKADLGSGKLGVYDAAFVGEVTLQAESLKVALDFPIYQDAMSGVLDLNDGLIMDNASCRDQSSTDMLDALFDAGVLADTLVSALDDDKGHFYSQFFQANQLSKIKVPVQAAADIIKGKGPHVDAYCSDLDHLLRRKHSRLLIHPNLCW